MSQSVLGQPVTQAWQQRSLAHMLQARVAATPDLPAYREFAAKDQPWTQLSWAQAGAAVMQFRAALQQSGIQHGERIGIWLPNSINAMCADQGALQMGAIAVPVHTTDNPASIAYIFDNAEISLLVLSSLSQWQRLRATDYAMPSLHTVVVADGVPPTSSIEGQPLVVDQPRLLSLADWLQEGAAMVAQPAPALPEPGDVAAIVYTSGTTGKPKGVMLTHANVMANVSDFAQRVQPRQDDRFLSFLPLSHTFERTVGYYLSIASGACTAYARSAALLMQDMQTEKPTILVCVPRIYERVHAKMLEKILAGPEAERQAFEAAVEWGWANFCARQDITDLHKHDADLIGTPAPAAHAQLGQQIAQMFGGCVRMAITGGAAIPQSTARAFLALDVPLLQGYGMTETTPVISVVTLDSNDPATVGAPLPSVEIRIGEQHELQVRGATVMKGYWKRPEETAAAFTQDGWLRTGDQAELVKGRIRIKGRLKELIVTSTGEKISPTDLEQSMLADPLIEQIMVLGDHRPYVSAIAVLSEENWPLFAKDNGWDASEPETLRQPAVVQTMLKRLQALCADFPSYAQPRALLLTLEPWSVENQLLTPTMKVKRQPILARYAQEVESIYGNRRMG
ncbi:long-chain fatty acid--CoA ligase [Comamonas sp. Y33R10-2]|uniref:AMP-dependent synthetase/ligase n=1 Tax=Comamonas sp. Y33R10-2 TaxID=2853257 RepID=UPI001C5C8C2E|nr:long-chain fatty acid--CoA ligase [Comamonas sp. Y33R10-2]QXZ08303.1 long-chain fatty acid--CoA ligase [Comamonas sp. Y33R10-2]